MKRWTIRSFPSLTLPIKSQLGVAVASKRRLAPIKRRLKENTTRLPFGVSDYTSSSTTFHLLPLPAHSRLFLLMSKYHSSVTRSLKLTPSYFIISHRSAGFTVSAYPHSTYVPWVGFAIEDDIISTIVVTKRTKIFSNVSEEN